MYLWEYKVPWNVRILHEVWLRRCLEDKWNPGVFKTQRKENPEDNGESKISEFRKEGKTGLKHKVRLLKSSFHSLGNPVRQFENLPPTKYLSTYFVSINHRMYKLAVTKAEEPSRILWATLKIFLLFSFSSYRFRSLCDFWHPNWLPLPIYHKTTKSSSHLLALVIYGPLHHS